MLEKLFYNIGFFYTKIRFFRKKDTVQKFTTFLYRNSRILVIMPFELGEFDIAKATMFNIKNEWPNLQISMVVQAQYLTYSGIAGVFGVFALGIKDVNKFSLPTRKFMKPILTHEYDAVIDFNNVMSLTSSFISKRIEVKYRISFVKEYVDNFFNVQFNQESITKKKTIYLKLMTNLKMFCSNEDAPKPKPITTIKDQTSEQPAQNVSGQKQSKDTKEDTKSESKPEDTKKDTKSEDTKENTIEKTNKEENNENKKQPKRRNPKHKNSR
jgi:ADP-heptose:LPS heptosyltransferase